MILFVLIIHVIIYFFFALLFFLIIIFLCVKNYFLKTICPLIGAKLSDIIDQGQ
jgi:Na+/melibiose symporter-like transporter